MSLVATLRFAALVPALLLGGGRGGATGETPAGASAPPHPLHLSTTYVAIDEEAVFLRVRLFKNDLESALAAASGLESLDLSPTPAHDSLFLAYFTRAFELRFDGETVAPVLTASGEDESTKKGDERIWWAELRYDTPGRVDRLRVRARQLFEWFEDQRNVVRVLRTSTGKQKTLYFAAPDDDWSEVRLD
jgi:hypothetical protein